MADAIFPNSLSSPSAQTTPIPRPKQTTVPLYPIFLRSPSGAFSAKVLSQDLLTSLLSPVKEDSSILSLTLSISRKSAGIILPASSTTTSPSTRSAVLIFFFSPPRRTTHSGCDSLFNASIDFSALCS